MILQPKTAFIPSRNLALFPNHISEPWPRKLNAPWIDTPSAKSEELLLPINSIIVRPINFGIPTIWFPKCWLQGTIWVPDKTDPKTNTPSKEFSQTNRCIRALTESIAPRQAIRLYRRYRPSLGQSAKSILSPCTRGLAPDSRSIRPAEVGCSELARSG